MLSRKNPRLLVQGTGECYVGIVLPAEGVSSYLYCRIDLHSTNSVIAVTDEHDYVLYSKRLANDLNTI